jgi:glucokinase
VDVGGTKVAVAALGDSGMGEPHEVPTDVSSPDALLDGIAAAVDAARASVGEPAAIGIGMPSQIEFASGAVVASVNIPLEGVGLRDVLGKRFGVPVFVDNDANCAALAEVEAHDPRPGYLVMLTLGTGVGGGIVIDGRIFRGATGLGAELGHVTIDADGPACPGSCPNRGCIEALCSGTALGRDGLELAEDHPDSPLGRVLAEKGEVHAEDVVASARGGDAQAQALLDRLGMYLGVALTGVVNVFEPELVAIGGGLSRASDLFLETAVAEMRGRALPALAERAKVSLAQGGAAAGVAGAALLARHELTGA